MKRIAANGRFDHPAGAPPFTGTLNFHAQSNTMALNQIAIVRARQPDLHGTAQFRGEGSARIGRDAKGELTLNLVSVNGDAGASKIELDGRDLGDAHLTASTSQDTMTVRFDSNAAGASIHGSATVQLERDYPLSGAVTFSRARLNALAMLIAKPEQARHLNFDGIAAGELTVRGPARDWRRLTGTLTIPEIEIYPVAAGNCGTESTCAGFRGYRLQNKGAVQLSLANGIVDVGSARFTGPQTDIALSGTLGFTERTGYNLRAVGDLNLALPSTLSTDFATSGSLHVDAALRGALNAPDVSGRIEIRNGAARYTGFGNGLSSVNAALVFNGDRATIQNFSAESGGGQVNMSGFIALTGGLVAFRLQARTTGVRLRFAEGASVVSDSTITLAGTSQRSEASGTVTVHRVTINPRADLSSIFARTAEPVKAATVQAGLLSKLNLDVQIETAPDVALETSMAQRIQAEANLRLRGTATNPALLGRINITSGELMFFGNKYAITQGAVSFLNPSRIDPILNVDLETRARGVDVILTIAGPLTKPGVSYRSDPPLQFSDIVALLATGRSPFDPGLPSGTVGQQQAFAQLGASQLIGEAINNPASGRLQRFFGVTKAKIDPQLTDVTGSPESRLTIEQQVSPDILFTYITDVSNTSTQLIRVEWAFNRHWSAIVTREENGYVGLDFSYRQRFR
jgi:translocation and assembly module TamB